jgi:hypothetical protein
LLDFSLGGEEIGGEVKLDRVPTSIPFTAKLRSIVPVDHFELVCNGRMVQDLPLKSPRNAADANGEVALEESGWCLLRASSNAAEYPILDSYVYATTSPIYVTIGDKRPKSVEDAKYFVTWMDRVIGSTSRYPDWNSAGEKELVMKRLRDAKAVFEKLL